MSIFSNENKNGVLSDLEYSLSQNPIKLSEFLEILSYIIVNERDIFEEE